MSAVLTPSQAASAARLIKNAQASGTLNLDALPHAAAVLVGSRRKKGTRGREGLLSSAWVAKSTMEMSFDAGLLVDAITVALLVYYRSTVRAGVKPTGLGVQPRLSEQSLKKRGRVGKVRGYFSGLMADTLRRSRLTGTTVSSRSRIMVATNRNVVIATELQRGIRYLELGGKADAVIAEAVKRFVEGGMRNRNRAAEPESKAAGLLGLVGL